MDPIIELSIVIPAQNESGHIQRTLRDLELHLSSCDLDYEIVVVDDHSTDGMGDLVQQLSQRNSRIKLISNPNPSGFGYAVRAGLSVFRGKCVVIYMADGSDCAKDLLNYYDTWKKEKVDCVFGSRFIKGGTCIDYPKHKWVLNRLVNQFIRILFGISYNDVTNAFKLYQRNVIEGVSPLISPHFNLTVEIPLKAIIRGYRYHVVANQWKNRTQGVSKLKIKEMGSRYLFIIIYCFIEKWLSRGDYHVQNQLPKLLKKPI